MLTSKARRRVALKTSAMAVLGAGIFGSIPVVAAMAAAPVDVAYTCIAGQAGVPTATKTIPFRMELKTPVASITPSATVTITWDVQQPTATASHLLAPTDITPSSTVVAAGTVSPSGSPLPSTAIIAGATATPLALVTEGATMALPTMTMVVTPTATGTVVLKGGGFALQVNGTQMYNCQPGTSGGPSANLVVATGTGTGTTTPTATNTTPTPTATSTSPRPTTTHTKTETVTPTGSTTRKSQTPKAGADTGAGGTMGPDGRLFILTGTVLVGAAAAGGLIMRRRSIKG